MGHELKRDVPVDTQVEIISEFTRPVLLVRVILNPGPSETRVYMSDGPAITFETNAYVEGGVEVGTFSWTPDGGQSGSLVLLNENNSATALVLGSGIADAPITIWQTYMKPGGGNTVPFIILEGVLDGAAIEPLGVQVGILSSKANSEFAPNRYFKQSEGFNFLPPLGTLVHWNDESYVLTGVR